MGLHSEVMFDRRLVDGALDGADCEVVDTVVDIPSLMQVVDGRRGPPTREYKAVDVVESSLRRRAGLELGRAAKLGCVGSVSAPSLPISCEGGLE